MAPSDGLSGLREPLGAQLLQHVLPQLDQVDQVDLEKREECLTAS